MKPTPTFAEYRATLNVHERDHLDERAAIREFDGNLPRAEAEQKAVADMQRQRKDT